MFTVALLGQMVAFVFFLLRGYPYPRIGIGRSRFLSWANIKDLSIGQERTCRDKDRAQLVLSSPKRVKRNSNKMLGVYNIGGTVSKSGEFFFLDFDNASPLSFVYC